MIRFDIESQPQKKTALQSGPQACYAVNKATHFNTENKKDAKNLSSFTQDCRHPAFIAHWHIAFTLMAWKGFPFIITGCLYSIDDNRTVFI